MASDPAAPGPEPGPAVDVVVIHRPGAPPRGPVLEAVASQAGVTPRIHCLAGAPTPLDPNRWATIARARNAAKAVGSAPRFLFLDDDVLLAPDCLSRLVEALDHHPRLAAAAADYLGESGRAGRAGDPGRHVAMGATLFRRAVLDQLTFRWEPDRCECQCACDDLRRAGLGIEYVPGAGARHLSPDGPAGPGHADRGLAPAGRVLAAFDRRHLGRFRDRFLRTLRATGHDGPVTAVAYGLAPSEIRALARQPGVEVEPRRSGGPTAAVRRLDDFGTIVARWPGSTPVAYWDAGDVRFQARLEPLWAAVRDHPGKLLAAREPAGYPENGAVLEWTLSIADPARRRDAFDLLSRNPFLNSGFAAGDAGAAAAYFAEAARLRRSPALRGTTDWGDQTALNLYCHAEPDRWVEVSEGWNYCLFQRPADAYRVAPGGRLEAADGTPIRVVHGNGHSFRAICALQMP